MRNDLKGLRRWTQGHASAMEDSVGCLILVFIGFVCVAVVAMMLEAVKGGP